MRKYLLISLVVVCGLILGVVPALAQSEYKESPMLTELVEAGKLPPIEERLPEKPFVVGPGVLIKEEELPDWEPGQLGGTLRMYFTGTEGGGDYFCMLDEPLLSAPGLTVEGIRGNVLEDYEVGEDNKVFTFYMRKGLKWSDGEPVTSEDVLFTYEDVLLSEKITPTFPSQYKDRGDPQGEVMKLEVIDDYTFRISFNEPYGGFLRILTIESWVGYTDILRPKHYLEKFHIKYTPLEELEPLIKEAGFGEGEWWNLFNERDFTNWEQTKLECIGFPVLTPWIMSPTSTAELLVWERNPYYFKVDTEGSQLPYTDKVEGYHVENLETALLKILAGEIDFSRVGDITQLALLKEYEERGGYKVYLLDKHTDSAPVLLNYTYPDEVWREVVRDVRFREALNMGIDRGEIMETVYYGFASLPRSVPSEYDPDKANQLLDEMGLDKRDAEGWRLGPDGEVFVIPFETIGVWEADMIPVTELVVEHWKALGIKTTMKQVDPSLWLTRRDANQLQAAVLWAAHDKGWELGFGVDNEAQLWQVWHNTAGEEGEEPPDWIKRLFELNSLKRQAIPNSAEWKEIEEEMRSLEYDNILSFIVAERVKYPVILSADIGNIQQTGYGIAADFAAEQFFFKP